MSIIVGERIVSKSGELGVIAAVDGVVYISIILPAK